MSIRYGIGLALHPAFTLRVYRARQLICGQYASWAAEMNMVYVALTGYFEFPGSAIAGLETDLASVALRSYQDSPQFPISLRGVGTSPEAIGDIFLDFNGPGRSGGLNQLHDAVTEMLARTPGISSSVAAGGEGYKPRLPLMQYAQLPASVFGDAVEFARAAVTDLQVPTDTQAWRLLLLRFQSEAAGDNWGEGRWALDLRWELLASHTL